FTHDGQGNILKEWDQPYFVEQDKDERMFGALYLGEVASSTHDQIIYPQLDPQQYTALYHETVALVPFIEEQGGNLHRSPHYKDIHTAGVTTLAPVSDVYTSAVGADLHHAVAPTHIAFDDYLVSVPGIAGTITPYRSEVGNVALSYANSDPANGFIRRDYFAPWLKEGDAHYDKMGFYYKGQTANHYSHHPGNTTVASMRINSTLNNPINPSYPKMTFNLQDNNLFNASNRIDSRVDGTLKDNVLTADRHIRWFTNMDYQSGTAHSQGRAIDFLTGTARDNFRNARPEKGIGGFVVTDEQGYTYHFSLPVMRRNQVATSFDEGTPANANSSEIQGEYATEWLLTAVTGPDFVDNGTLGFIDGDEDGFWVVFD
ncbi:MAG: hypothetical protein AAGB22_14830, partial [Bacteroidota bacterium]